MKFLWTTLVIAIFFVTQHTKAALLFCDTFSDYENGSLIFQYGGVGGKGRWDSFDYPEGFIQPDKGQYRFVVTNTGLSGNLTTYAKSVVLPATSTNCEIKRKLGFTLAQNGTTRYMRFLLRANHPQGSLWPSASYLGVELRTGTQPSVYVGKGNAGTFVIGGAAASSHVATTHTFVASTSYVLVLKMQFQAGSDVLTLYVNPSPSAEPTSGTVRSNLDLGQPNIIALVGNLSMSVDEIVIADTYSEAMNVSSLPIISTITLDSGGAVEGDAGTNNLTFTARLSPAVSHQVSVDYKTLNGTATSGQDYFNATGTLIFAPGITTATGTVGIIGDGVMEPDETFFVNLAWPVSAKFASSAISITSPFIITNNDVSPPSPMTFTRSGNQFTVSWTASSDAYVLEATPIS